jgi:ATP-binding cassette subfamily C protein LapB
MLLDEPTARLDERTEAQLLQKALTIFKNRTVLMVTHSNRVLSSMDRIIRMDQGRLIIDH